MLPNLQYFSLNDCVIQLTGEVKELEGLGAPVSTTKVFLTGGEKMMDCPASH